MKKKSIVKKIIQKKDKKTTPQHFCIAEDCVLLEGGVLYGFTGLLRTCCPRPALPGPHAAHHHHRPHEAGTKPHANQIFFINLREAAKKHFLIAVPLRP